MLTKLFEEQIVFSKSIEWMLWRYCAPAPFCLIPFIENQIDIYFLVLIIDQFKSNVN